MDEELREVRAILDSLAAYLERLPDTHERKRAYKSLLWANKGLQAYAIFGDVLEQQMFPLLTETRDKIRRWMS